MDLARNLKIESVSRLHPSPPWSVSPDQTVAAALDLMRKNSQGCVLVCQNKRLVGIFTERDLIRRVLAARKPLTTLIVDCMTPNPVAVSPQEPISSAIRHMEEGGYRHLPVVVDGEPVGILSVKRIVHYLVEHFPGTVYNLPPEPSAVQQEREGA
jgi:CBS domain-containing protein